MSPFDWLLLAHLVGDYLFQTSWMAMNKAHKWDALIVHSLVYTGAIALVSYATFGLFSWPAYVVIFVSHLILDRRTFVVWWVRTVMRTNETTVPWLTIMVDQIFHLLVLAMVLQLF